MRFLADMGVSERLVAWLRDNGHDAVHLRELGLHCLPNGDIFKMAIDQQRVVLTFDLDFGEIVAASHGAVVSVVLFRLHNTTTPNLISRVEIVLLNLQDELEHGAVIVVEDARCRVRRLPIGR